MRIYDISVDISPHMPVCAVDDPVVGERVKAISRGANANASRLACGVHIGTHVDAPVHFIDGAPGVETLPLKVLTGRAYVVHLPKASVLDEATLEAAGLPPRTRRVLFRTRNSELWAREKTFSERLCRRRGQRGALAGAQRRAACRRRLPFRGALWQQQGDSPRAARGGRRGHRGVGPQPRAGKPANR